MSNYSLPLFMQVKANAVTDLNKNLNLYMPKLVFAKTLILTTEGLLQTLDRKVKILLNQLRGYEIVTVKESSFDFAVEVAKKVAMNNIRLVIGLGGGTALDTAKYAAFVANVAYIAIPTALSNDGVCSPVSVLLAQNGRRHSFTSKIPDGLLIDTDIIFEAPRLLLKAGVGDTISNYTALYDWQLGCDENNDRPNDFAYMLSETAFNWLLYSEEKSLTSIPGIKMLAQSLVLSGLSMQLAGNSRPCSGSEHLFSHAMDELFDHNIPHGILVGMGSVVSCKLQGRDHHVVLDFLKAYDISVNPAKLGITEDMFIKAWMFAKEVRKERYTILNKINLTEERSVTVLSIKYNPMNNVGGCAAYTTKDVPAVSIISDYEEFKQVEADTLNYDYKKRAERDFNMRFGMKFKEKKRPVRTKPLFIRNYSIKTAGIDKTYFLNVPEEYGYRLPLYGVLDEELSIV